MKNKKYISQMCFGSKFQIFVLLLAMIFTLTNIPVSAAITEDVEVGSKSKLVKEMKKKTSGKIVFYTNKEVSITIPAKKYAKNKDLEIDAPNASITNKAKFNSVTIKAVKSYTENVSGNIIKINGDGIKLNISDGKKVNDVIITADNTTISIKEKGGINNVSFEKNGATVKIEVADNSLVNANINKKTALTVLGAKSAEVNIIASAQSSSISASVPVNVIANKNLKLTLKKGSEGSIIEKKTEKIKVTIKNKSGKEPITKINEEEQCTPTPEPVVTEKPTATPTPSVTMTPAVTPTVTVTPKPTTTIPSDSDTTSGNASSGGGYSGGYSGGSSGGYSGGTSSDYSGGSSGGYSWESDYSPASESVYEYDNLDSSDNNISESKEDNSSYIPNLSDEMLEEVESRILYNLLDETEKEFYRRAYVAMYEMAEKVDINDLTLSGDSINKVFYYILSECPEMFWVDDTRYECSESVFNVHYVNTLEEKKSRLDKMSQIADQYIESEFDIKVLPIERILSINEFIAESEYDYGDDELRNTAGSDDILIDKKGLCVGFARAFSYMCQKAGFTSLVIFGKFDGGDEYYGHAYCIVYLDGKWYLVEPQEKPDYGDLNVLLHVRGKYHIAAISGRDSKTWFMHYVPDEIFNMDFLRPIGMLSDFKREKYACPDLADGFDILHEEGDFCFVDLEDGTLLLAEYTGENTFCVIPAVVDDKPVTYIHAKAFENSEFVEKIYIPETIKGIWNLLDVRYYGYYYMPKMLTEIDVSVDNPYLKSVDGVLYSKDGKILFVYPENKELTENSICEGIEEIYFLGQDRVVQKLIIPSSVKKIYWSTLFDSTIDQLVLSEGVLCVSQKAFPACYIKELSIPSSITYIDAYAFNGAYTEMELSPENMKYKLIDGNLCSIDGKKLIKSYFNGGDNVYRVPEGIEEIESLPLNSEVYIPSSVKVLYDDVLWDSDVRSVEVSDDNPYYCIFDNTLYTRDMKRLIRYFGTSEIEEYIVPYGVEELGKYAFRLRYKIKKIIIPETTKYLFGFALSATNADIIILGEIFIACNALWQCGKDTVLECKDGALTFQYGENEQTMSIPRVILTQEDIDSYKSIVNNYTDSIINSYTVKEMLDDEF